MDVLHHPMPQRFMFLEFLEIWNLPVSGEFGLEVTW
jgi:hypothetical protein